MARAHKSRIVVPLLLLSMLIPSSTARTADVSSLKASGARSAQGASSPQPDSRVLSRLEIFQSIQSYLARRGFRADNGLRPDDLQIQSSIPALQAGLGLVVKKIAYDPIRRETIFRLWTSGEPQYLPFEVSTRRDPRSLGIAGVLGWAPAGIPRNPGGTSQAGGSTPPRDPVLVKPGKSATLLILGDNVRITTTVVPLQQGLKGQSILVRDITSAHIFTAEVVSAGLLQARL